MKRSDCFFAKLRTRILVIITDQLKIEPTKSVRRTIFPSGVDSRKA